MSFGSTPTDNKGIPISSVYVPGVGFIALQGSTATSTDGSSNTSAPVNLNITQWASTGLGIDGTKPQISLYVKTTTAGDTVLTMGQVTMANSLPVVIASDQSNLPSNLKQINGSALALGQTTMASSLPITVASDQSNLPANIKQVNGSSLALGQTTMSASLPVALASDQSSVPIKQPTSATGTLTSVAGATTNTQLLASNTSRKGMMVYNDSTAIMYLAFNATASTTSYTVQVPPSGFFEMPTAPVYTGQINAVWSVANGNARITELT